MNEDTSINNIANVAAKKYKLVPFKAHNNVIMLSWTGMISRKTLCHNNTSTTPNYTLYTKTTQLQGQITALHKIVDELTGEKATLIKEVYLLKERISQLENHKPNIRLRSNRVVEKVNKNTVHHDSDNSIIETINSLEKMNKFNRSSSSEDKNSTTSLSSPKPTKTKKSRKNK
ncbi:hypothetical protein GJ496_005571 [Pomphorhynchus laevis]|nr:hypothetical protein GJ496_005571 [Pomphorhynchus laevis]